MERLPEHRVTDTMHFGKEKEWGEERGVTEKNASTINQTCVTKHSNVNAVNYIRQEQDWKGLVQIICGRQKNAHLTEFCIKDHTISSRDLKKPTYF